MDHNGSHFGADPFSISSDESHEGLGWFRDTKIGPCGEMEVFDGPDSVTTHHAEFRDVPIGEMRFVEDGDLNVPVVDGLRVKRPVVITFLSAFLHTTGEHDNGTGIGLPTHSPEVVSCRVQRALQWH